MLRNFISSWTCYLYVVTIKLMNLCSLILHKNWRKHTQLMLTQDFCSLSSFTCCDGRQAKEKVYHVFHHAPWNLIWSLLHWSCLMMRSKSVVTDYLLVRQAGMLRCKQQARGKHNVHRKWKRVGVLMLHTCYWRTCWELSFISTCKQAYQTWYNASMTCWHPCYYALPIPGGHCNVMTIHLGCKV
jgi:uncharacterized membrane protein (UPF0182 family)